MCGMAKTACVRAGYAKTMNVYNTLLTRPAVIAAIEEGRKRLRTVYMLDEHCVWAELQRVLGFDPIETVDEKGNAKLLPQIDEEARLALVEHNRKAVYWQGEKCGENVEVKYPDKASAIRLVAQILGMVRERVEHTGTVTLRDLLAHKDDPAPDAVLPVAPTKPPGDNSGTLP